MSKRKVSLTPDKISEKWNRRLKGAVADIQSGIDNVTESPAEKAIAKKEKFQTRLNESINNGTWEAGLSKVSLPDWKATTKKKVGERLASGVDGAMNKRKAFDTWLAGRLNAVLPKIDEMPDLTLEDSVARVRAMMEHMQKEKYKKS